MSNVIPMMRRLGAAQAAEDQPEAAGAPEPQPPARAQLAGDISATAQQLRSATAQLVAVAPASGDTQRLLATYNSLLSTLQDLHGRLEGATDNDLVDIGRDFQGTVAAAQEYLTEAGKLIGSTSAALAPAGRPRPRWLMILAVLAAAGAVGGGYYFWKKRRKRGPKLGRPPKSKTDD